MKKSQLLGVVCAGVVTLLASVTANASIVYNLDRTIGAGTVTGFIETDGSIGVLGSSNITDWALTLTAPNLLGGPIVTLNASDTGSTTTVSGSSLTATTDALSFNFSADGHTDYMMFKVGSVGYCIHNCLSGWQSEAIMRATSPSNTDAAFTTPTGTIDIAVSAVPVPAAVWLFGSGLLGLVGVARRKARA